MYHPLQRSLPDVVPVKATPLPVPTLIPPNLNKVPTEAEVCKPPNIFGLAGYVDIAFALKAGGEMSYNMYDLSRKESPSINIIFSPLSILFALNLLYPGSGGGTKKEIQNFLTGGGVPFEPLPPYSYLYRIIEGSGKYKELLYMANKVFAQDGFHIEGNYNNALNYCFNTDAFEEVDFYGQPEECRKAINEYVENATKNRITDLLPENSIKKMTRLVLVNSLYFKAEWDVPFTQDARIVEQDFANLDGTKSSMKFMSQGRFRPFFYSQKKVGDVFVKVLGVPYKEDYDMFFVLPDNFLAFEAMDEKFKPLSELIQVARKNFVSVDALVPKFTLNYEMPLKKVLKKAGLVQMFNETVADFTGISKSEGQRLYVGGAYHKGFIQVNENGTEAAAATGVVIDVETGSRYKFHPTTPFLFLIQHRSVRTILFMGAILKAPDEE